MIPADPNPFPDWLRAELSARGWSQTDLADRVGVTHTAVSHWLSGRRRPHEIFAERIAAALAAEPADPTGGTT